MEKVNHEICTIYFEVLALNEEDDGATLRNSVRYVIGLFGWIKKKSILCEFIYYTKRWNNILIILILILFFYYLIIIN